MTIAAFVPDGPDHALRREAVYATFQRELHARYDATGVREVAGATAAIDWLKSRGVRIALNTGFDRPTTERLLQHLARLADAADAIV